tara:strand:+ start:83 stop:334 length:252 start_codon:yes stop_codon:yes gene_type:complete
MDPIKLIINQTTYSEEYAKKMLEDNNGDYMKVIKKYLNIDNEPKKMISRPYHQMKMDVLRSTLDDANLKYREKKERETNDITI